jgi:hypothetical protein
MTCRMSPSAAVFSRVIFVPTVKRLKSITTS